MIFDVFAAVAVGLTCYDDDRSRQGDDLVRDGVQPMCQGGIVLAFRRSWPSVTPSCAVSNRSVAAINADDHDLFVWDDGLPGFGVRVKPSGVKSYILQYRNRHNISRRYTIGRDGIIGAERARAKAKSLLAKVQDGADPAAERKEAREAHTVADLADRYMAEHAEVKKRPRSVESDKTLLRLHVLPTLGRKNVAALTRADVTGLHHSLKAKPGAANRTLALVSKMLNLAE